MLGHKLYFLFVISSLYILIGSGKKHKKSSHLHARNYKRFQFHATQNVDDLVKNPSAMNRDEINQIDKLDNMNEVFMNPEVSSESQDLSRQGLDPSVAMQISKLDHNFQDILGPTRSNRLSSNARQKGDILQGYGEQFNADGSISLSNNEWPEYQIKDTPPMGRAKMHGGGGMQGMPGSLQGMPGGMQGMPGSMEGMPGNMFAAGGGDNTPPLLSPQNPIAANNPNLLPGQKSDLGMGMGMGEGMKMVPGMDKAPGAGPTMARFMKDNPDEKSTDDKPFVNPAFAKPDIKNAGFRIPGEFSFKGERKSAESQEDANFVKNFMSSKKSRTEERKTSKKANH